MVTMSANGTYCKVYWESRRRVGKVERRDLFISHMTVSLELVFESGKIFDKKEKSQKRMSERQK